jgi:hypothetical protein
MDIHVCPPPAFELLLLCASVCKVIELEEKLRDLWCVGKVVLDAEMLAGLFGSITQVKKL